MNDNNGAVQRRAVKIIAKQLKEWIPYPPPMADQIIDALNKAGLVVVRQDSTA